MSKKVNSAKAASGQSFVLGRQSLKGDVSSLVSQGRKALDQKRVWEAEQAARAALDKKPDYGPAQVLLGLVAAQTGKLQFAADMLERGLKPNEDDPQARDTLANLLLRFGKLNAAKTMWQEMIQRNPNYAPAYVGLGLCASAEQLTDEALANFEKAIKLAPETASSHFHYARALEAVSRIREAIQAYQMAIKLQPNNPNFYPALGLLLTLSNQSTAAVACYRKAYELNPNSSDANYFLAQALLEEDKSEEAEKAIRRALQLHTKSAKAYAVLGSIQQQMGRFDEAKASLFKAIELQPEFSTPYSVLSTGLKFTEEDRPFVDKMEEVLQLHKSTRSGQEQIHYALAKAKSDLKEYEQAMAHYDQANQLAFDRNKDFGIMFDPKSEAGYVRLNQAVYTKEFFEQRKGLGDPTELPLFVVGMIRSGTTLTEQILTSHPQIGRAGEQRFWLENAPNRKNQIAPDFGEEYISRVSKEYMEVISRYVEPGDLRVTDKMPLNFATLGPIHATFPNARIVHCRRNAVDNCLSIYMTQYKGSPNFGHSRDNIVSAYRLYRELMDHWRATLPADRFFEVQYEDLVSDQEYWIRKMIEFVGLEWDDACLSPEDNKSNVSTPSVWQVRQPIYKSSTEKWRKYEPWLGPFSELIDLG